MRVLGREKLIKFCRKHVNTKGAIDAWFIEIECADWQTSHDIKSRYPSADFLANNRVIFNIKGNHYRLVVRVRYQHGVVLVEWVGTHAEYDKKTF